MSAWQWIVAVHLAAWAAVAVLAWRHWRASRHTAGVEDGQGRQTWADEPGDPTRERIDEALAVVEQAKADHLNAAMRRLTDEWLPLHRTEAGYPNCATCDGGGCPDCTEEA